MAAPVLGGILDKGPELFFGHMAKYTRCAFKFPLYLLYSNGKRYQAILAQLVEHVFRKDGVRSSILRDGS
jgi:hypothetical protein